MRDSEQPIADRRAFFRRLFDFGHQPQLLLADIPKLPDSVVAEMIPVWMEGVEFDIRDDGIYCQNPEGEVYCAHAFSGHEIAMLDQYACGRNLRCIADNVAHATGVSCDEAFAAARALFEKLCEYGWCHPAAAHFDTSSGDQR